MVNKLVDKQKLQMIALKDGRFHVAALAVDPQYLSFELARHLELTGPLTQDLRLVAAFPLAERQFVDDEADITASFMAKERGIGALDVRQFQISGTLSSIVAEAGLLATAFGVPYFLVHVLETTQEEPVHLGGAPLKVYANLENKTYDSSRKLVSLRGDKPEPRAFSLQPTVNLYAPVA